MQLAAGRARERARISRAISGPDRLLLPRRALEESYTLLLRPTLYSIFFAAISHWEKEEVTLMCPSSSLSLSLLLVRSLIFHAPIALADSNCYGPALERESERVATAQLFLLRAALQRLINFGLPPRNRRASRYTPLAEEEEEEEVAKKKKKMLVEERLRDKSRRNR